MQITGESTLLQEPPIPSRTLAVKRMSAKESRNATLVVAAIGCAILLAAAVMLSRSLGCAGVLAFFGVALVIGSFARKSLITGCPYCMAKIGGILGNRDQQVVRCSKCFEYSLVESGRIRALDPKSKFDKQWYWSPVFEGAVWPEGCVECGSPPTHRVEIRDGNLNVLALTIGVAMLSRASLGNVPYSDTHRDAVQLSYSQTKKMDLQWKSLRMMRCHIAANRGKPMLGTQNLINP